MKPETDNKKVIDSVRFYPALKADLTLICKEAGVTKQRVIEDALNYYFGDRGDTLAFWKLTPKSITNGPVNKGREAGAKRKKASTP